MGMTWLRLYKLYRRAGNSPCTAMRLTSQALRRSFTN
jgi:hypothetical protein